MSHPIRRFFDEYLQLTTINKWASLNDYKSNTINNWINRDNKRIDTLPVGFVKEIGKTANMNIDETYSILKKYEDEDK